MQTILFLCTGNYYRSRFAEEYFNHLVAIKNLNWKAFSKGLSQNMPSLNNPGTISVHALEALKDMQVIGKELDRFPQPIIQADFKNHEKIIALSEAEHKPMLKKRFENHYAKVNYFEVGDLPVEEPKDAMKKLAFLVEELIGRLN